MSGYKVTALCSRYILTAIVIVGFQFCLLGQQTPPIVVPTILPPSPEATALGKYGDLPVGMFTGTPSVNVGLYTMKTKHLSLPISIDYSSNGIKVDEISSKVGMSWVLNCGGMISRTVYGKPDLDEYIVAPAPPDQNWENAGTDTLLAAWMQDMGNSNDDFQMDAFNYNFNGYTGKFFIQPGTGLPLIAPYSNLNIQYSLTQTNWNFKITTPDGTIYYFGGTGATEYVEDESSCTGSNHWGQVPMGWYLTKIQYPTDPSDSIHFFYNPVFYEYATGLNETVTYLDATSAANLAVCSNGNTANGNYLCTCGPTPFIYGGPTPTNGQGVPQLCQNVSGTSSVCLSQITDGNYNLIKFNYILKPDLNYDSLVAGITVYNNQTGNKIKSYSFVYTDVSPDFTGSSNTYSVNTPRPFLTEVDQLDSTGAVILPWKFSYIDYSNLPARLSFSQDYWGYFNGIVNPSAFPLPVTGYASIASGLIANRNPDYNSAGLGMLSQITYPTGGTMNIQYEGNTMDSTYTIASQSTSVTYLTGIQTIDVNNTNTGQTNATFQVLQPISVNVTETLSCASGSTCPTESNTAYWGELVLNNADVLQATYEKYNTRQEEVEAVVTMTLQPGVYGLDVLPNGNYVMDLNVQPTNASDTLYLINIANQVPLTNSVSFTAGGMRVRRTLSYDPVANNMVIKHYYYDQAVFPVQPVFYNHLTHYESLSTGNFNAHCLPVADANTWAGYNQFFSSSLTNLYGTGTSSVYYPQVRESFGDNFENGGIQHHYSYTTFIPVQYVYGQAIPNVVAPNLNWQNGLETSMETYKMVNGAQVPVQVKKMAYNIDPRNTDTVNQFTVLKVGNNTNLSTNPSTISQDYCVAEVSYITQWQYMNSQITQDYDINGNLMVVDTVNYFYDNPAHAMLTRTEKTDSKGQNEREVRRYPQDADSFALTSPGETFIMNSLISQGRIGQLIEDENDRNNRLVRRVHNTFNGFSNGIILSQNMEQENGNGALYMDYTVNNYDPTGNIVQVTPKEGVIQNYIWDYHSSYPIAKVQNADSVDIAYTSFEADGTGGWSIGTGALDPTKAFTGTSSFNLSSGSTISASGLNSSTTYIVSYWTENSSPFNIAGTISGYPVQGKTETINNHNWTLYVHKVTGQSTITLNAGGGGHIDELRLYPSTAQMTTYTYSPLVGMTSQTDVGNRVTYYEYDGLQRLKRIRDQDYNIIKTYEYQYQAAAGCTGCQSVAMETFAGTNTIGYPVGVFDIHGNLVGNAAGASAYVSLWNSDTADARVGTLSAGNDSLHFNMVLHTGQTLPASVTGCRYYQYDLSYNQLDGVRYTNGTYVDFGDSTGMHLGTGLTDTPRVLAPRTTVELVNDFYYDEVYLIHTYPGSNLKTITFYHNDANENSALDNANNPAASLMLVTNLRGNLPQYTNEIGGSSYQQPGALTVSGITNWNSISSVHYFDLQNGDRVNNVNHVSYAQDFMQNNKGLDSIYTTECSDTAFKISLLKSNWSTWFTNLRYLAILDNQWNREDLSTLPNLSSLQLVSTSTDTIGVNGIPVIDNIINQIYAGSGQTISNGEINIAWPGHTQGSASQAAFLALKNKGWTIYMNGVAQ